MNRTEKQLANKLVKGSASDFTPEENIILEHWDAKGMLNKAAFHDATAGNAAHKQYIRGIGYPFSNLGDEEFHRHWYLQFRNSIGVAIVSDIMTVFAFLFSLYLAISGIGPR